MRVWVWVGVGVGVRVGVECWPSSRPRCSPNPSPNPTPTPNPTSGGRGVPRLAPPPAPHRVAAACALASGQVKQSTSSSPLRRALPGTVVRKGLSVGSGARHHGIVYRASRIARDTFPLTLILPQWRLPCTMHRGVSVSVWCGLCVYSTGNYSTYVGSIELAISVHLYLYLYLARSVHSSISVPCTICTE